MHEKVLKLKETLSKMILGKTLPMSAFWGGTGSKKLVAKAVDCCNKGLPGLFNSWVVRMEGDGIPIKNLTADAVASLKNFITQHKLEKLFRRSLGKGVVYIEDIK